jgi:hypothetical protein
MTESPIQQHDQEDDLTLRDLIYAYRTYRREAMRFWWLYALLFMVFGGFLVYRALTTPATYEARLTFMVNEDEGGGGFGGLSVLNQLGLGRGRAGRFNLDKIVELARSRKIIQQVLLAPFSDSTGTDFIGNALIREYDLATQWGESDPDMEGFQFTRDSVPAFDIRERSALLWLHAMLVGDEKNEGLSSASYDDLSSILSLTCETTNQDLSIAITRTQFERLGEFYIDQAIERQQKTFEVISEKVDSIAAVLSKTDIELAVYTDASNNLFSRVDQVKGQRLNRELLKLAAMQGEAVKNMEYAQFMLKNARPVIQELDLPISPLTPQNPSLPKAILIAAALSLVLVTAYVVLRKAVRDTLAGTKA